MNETKVTKQNLRLFFDMLVPTNHSREEEKGDWRTILFEAVLLDWYNELEKRQDTAK